jgi:hypothetical protein
MVREDRLEAYEAFSSDISLPSCHTPSYHVEFGICHKPLCSRIAAWNRVVRSTENDTSFSPHGRQCTRWQSCTLQHVLFQLFEPWGAGAATADPDL